MLRFKRNIRNTSHIPLLLPLSLSFPLPLPLLLLLSLILLPLPLSLPLPLLFAVDWSHLRVKEQAD